jgi:hypothetical protein
VLSASGPLSTAPPSRGTSTDFGNVASCEGGAAAVHLRPGSARQGRGEPASPHGARFRCPCTLKCSSMVVEIASADNRKIGTTLRFSVQNFSITSQSPHKQSTMLSTGRRHGGHLAGPSPRSSVPPVTSEPGPTGHRRALDKTLRQSPPTSPPVRRVSHSCCRQRGVLRIRRILYGICRRFDCGRGDVTVGVLRAPSAASCGELRGRVFRLCGRLRRPSVTRLSVRSGRPSRAAFGENARPANQPSAGLARSALLR